MKPWWQMSIQEVINGLGADSEKGLTSSEVRLRRDKIGPNQLKEKRGHSAFRIFYGQFRDLIIWVLIGASLVSFFLQEWVDALAIIVIIILNAILGFIQEYKAEKSLSALKELSAPFSKTIRDGQRLLIPSAELVPGDIIELESGDHVPADSRLLWLSANFSVQEASLTGESTPVIKTSHPLNEKEVPLAERANMAYLGTSVASGKAKALVVETGMNTELGKIAGMIQEIEQESTPLQRKLEEFGKWIVYLCFVLVSMVFLLGILRGGSFLNMFLTAVSLAVAAIPEGLPAVVTIVLSLGVQRMIKRNVLIRRLSAVETLGCATVICSDKTGTLTKNEMTVQAVFADNRLFKVTGIGYDPQGEFLLSEEPISLSLYPGLSKALLAGVLCNGAQLVKDNGGYRIVGDPTEGAILTLSAKAGIWKEEAEKEYTFIDELPFDSERKKMTVVRREKERFVAFVKGAPDVLLNDCVDIEEKGIRRGLTEEDRENILKANNGLTDSAMRVLGVACRVLDSLPSQDESGLIERGLTFLGLIAMIDPAREEVKRAIEECNAAGIKTVMITGDHKNTAVAIARHLGFFEEGSLSLTGEELDRLSDAELKERVKNIPVYARVSPEHKLRIVRAWQAHNEVVAMTGDGVNDAPAVKEADIGCAMGITGTDVTKEVAGMVITDDNFASIVSAVREGRGIYDNIRKFVHYLLSCNAGEILVMFVASLFGLPVPLLPIQILWVNLVTDGFPALALGVEPIESDVMKRPPRPVNEKVVTKTQSYLMLVQGGFIAFCSLLSFCFVLFVERGGITEARTAAFVVLAVSQLFHSFNCRNMTESLFKIGLFTNKKLLLAIVFSFLLQMAAVYVPFLQGVFKTEPLSGPAWLLVIAISSFPLWAMELVKRLKNTTCHDIDKNL
ncbi:MAG: calcium-transporting P-type ATPase, PMR1-type [Candidatus Omnitrophota bacterium]